MEFSMGTQEIFLIARRGRKSLGFAEIPELSKIRNYSVFMLVGNGFIIM